MAVIPCPKCQSPLDIPKPAPERIRCSKCGAVIKNMAAAQAGTGKVPVRAARPTVEIGPAVNTAIFEKNDLIPQNAGSQPRASHEESSEARPKMAGISPADTPGSKRNLAGLIAVIGAGLLLVGGGIGLGAWVFLSQGEKATEQGERASELRQGEKTPELRQGEKATEPEPADNQPVIPILKHTKKEAKEKKPRDPRVQKAIDRGVDYLRQNSPAKGKKTAAGDEAGLISLAGLAMLEGGVKAEDPVIQKMAEVIRNSISHLNTTYALGPAILFLDRLHHGEVPNEDSERIKTLGLRLLTGQTNLNIWAYDCPPNRGAGDMSNTQFAALGLWVARKYDVPVQDALRKAAYAARKWQNTETGTWTYYLSRGHDNPDTATCVGLILLSLGRAVDETKKDEEKKPGDFLDDPAVKKGLNRLAKIITDDVAAHKGKSVTHSRFKAWGDLYFLWALERTALILQRDKLGEHDWHAWGSEIILQKQNQTDGSWRDQHPGVADTTFALLFLVGDNLFKDLTDKLELSDAGESLDGLALARNEE